VVLTLAGELDAASAPALDERLTELLAEAHASVVLDLVDLQFVDSAGVSVLIRAKKQAEARTARLMLRRPTEQVQRVFALVGLADWLEYED
jgi:anti-sigma B factor antagonist